MARMALLLSLLLVSSFYLTNARGPDGLPLGYAGVVIDDGTCPSGGTETSQINEEVANLIKNQITPALLGRPPKCPGASQSNPAESCQAIFECGLGLLSTGSYWITDGLGSIRQVVCNMATLCGTDGGWMQVANLDMSDPTQVCPSGWRYFSSPVRSCGRFNVGGESQDSVTYSTYNVSFSRVCGKIIAYQYGRPDGFSPYSSTETIDDVYVDGITITYGSPRQHIWTFAALKGDSDTGNSVCPCSDPGTLITIPPWVGDDYFCEAGTDTGVRDTFYSLDPLFDGQNCPAPSTCCEFNNPPWFSKELDSSSTGNVEVRVMGNFDDEDNPINNMEIWVQ